MAIILNEEDKQQQQQAQAPSMGAQAIGGQSAVAPKKAQGSGLFTNLNRYVDANKGNQAVTGAVNEIGGKADAAQGDYNAAKNQFDNIQGPQDNLVASKAGVDNWLGQARTKVDQAEAAYNAADQEYITNPNDITSQNRFMASQQRDMTKAGIKNEAEQQRASIDPWKYQGTSTGQVDSGFNNLSNSINAAENTQRLVGNADVRAQHLKEKYNAGRGDYSSGQGRLDNFLVNNEGRDTFNAKRDALQGVMNSREGHLQRRNDLNTSIQNQDAKAKSDRLNYFNKLNQFVTW